MDRRDFRLLLVLPPLSEARSRDWVDAVSLDGLSVTLRQGCAWRGNLAADRPDVVVAHVGARGASLPELLELGRRDPERVTIALVPDAHQRSRALTGGLYDAWIEPDPVRAAVTLRHAAERIERGRAFDSGVPWQDETQQVSRRLLESVTSIEDFSRQRTLTEIERSIPPLRRRYRVV